MVLMTANNWNRNYLFHFDVLDKARLLKEIEKFAKLKNFSPDDFTAANDDKKHIGPIFMKNFDVPIIDNNHDISSNNPGMLGITVKSFDGWTRGYDLKEALYEVKQHYASPFSGTLGIFNKFERRSHYKTIKTLSSSKENWLE